MNVNYKSFRDNKTKLIISYWTMNKGERFTTCDLSNTGLTLGEDNQILDYGCTFLIQGSASYQEVGTEVITTVYPGDSVNRRPLKAIMITALEDDTRWCYALHFNSLFTDNASLGLSWDCPNGPKVITGEQIKIEAGETLKIVDKNRDFYIANPLYGLEENIITYKSPNDEEFNDFKIGRYLKVEKGETFNFKSTIDTYIPKIYLDNIN